MKYIFIVILSICSISQVGAQIQGAEFVRSNGIPTWNPKTDDVKYFQSLDTTNRLKYYFIETLSGGFWYTPDTGGGTTDTHLMSTNQTNTTGGAILHDGNAQAFGITNIGTLSFGATSMTFNSTGSITANATGATSDVSITAGRNAVLSSQSELGLFSFNDEIVIDAASIVNLNADDAGLLAATDRAYDIRIGGTDAVGIRKDGGVTFDRYGGTLHDDTATDNIEVFTIDPATDKAEMTPYDNGKWTSTYTTGSETNAGTNTLTHQYGFYQRNGAIVDFKLKFTVNSTTTGSKRFDCTVPFNSVLTDFEEFVGSAEMFNVAKVHQGSFAIQGSNSTPSDVVQVFVDIPATGTDYYVIIHGSYEIK